MDKTETSLAILQASAAHLERERDRCKANYEEAERKLNAVIVRIERIESQKGRINVSE